MEFALHQTKFAFIPFPDYIASKCQWYVIATIASSIAYQRGV